MTTATPALDELRAVAALHAVAQARSQRSSQHVAQLARSAYSQGAPLAEIARAAGVSRQYVHRLVNQQPKGTP